MDSSMTFLLGSSTTKCKRRYLVDLQRAYQSVGYYRNYFLTCSLFLKYNIHMNMHSRVCILGTKYLILRLAPLPHVLFICKKIVLTDLASYNTTSNNLKHF